MKKLLLILTTLILFSGVVTAQVVGSEGIILNTNTEVSLSNVTEEAREGKTLVQEWKQEIKEIKKDGFSLSVVISLVTLLISTIIFLGVCAVILLNIVQFFTPDEVDEKIEVIEDWITQYIIKLPIKLLAGLRKIVKKKS